MLLIAVDIHPEDQLLALYQEGCALEDFIEDFLELCQQVNWNEIEDVVLGWARKTPPPTHAHGGVQLFPAPLH